MTAHRYKYLIILNYDKGYILVFDLFRQSSQNLLLYCGFCGHFRYTQHQTLSSMRGWELPKSGINCDNVDEKSTGELFEEAKYFGLNNRG